MLSLLKHQFLDSISSSLTGGSRQSRIRYTCLDASEHYLVFGANTGSLYFYERETLNFVHLITTVQEPITQLIFSPNENYLAISTLKNFDIIILEPKLQTRKEKIVHRTTDHKAEITNMLWATLSPDNFRLYSSDESGVILATPIGAKAKGLFQTKIESDYLYKCDSRVVQLDFDAELNQLLASSLTRSILINFAKGSAVQVGKKLRDGTYGAVHYLMRQQTSVIGGDEGGARDGADGMEEVPINPDQSAANGNSANEGEKKKYLVLSRPGKRLWRADSENAKVLQTLNFQGSLTQAQLLPLFEDFLSEEKKAPPVLNNINFSKLTPLGECLLSWTDKSLILIDVESVEIIQWHADAVGLQDLVVYNNEAYAIHVDPIKISRIIFDVEAFIERLAKKGEWKRVIELIQKSQGFKVSWLEEISNLLAKSKTSTPEYISSLKEIIENAKKFKPTESRSPDVVHKPVEEVPTTVESIEPDKPVTATEPINNDDASSSAASEVHSEQDESQSQAGSQPIEVIAQATSDETTNGVVDQNNLNVSTSMPASQTEPIKISSPRAANSLPSSLTKDAEAPSSTSSLASSPSPSPSSSGIQVPKEHVMSSSPDSTDSSDRMASSVTSNEPLSDNPLVVHKTRSKKGRKSRMPVIAPLVTPVVFESSSEGNTPKSAPSTAFSSKDISPAVPKKDSTTPLSSSQPSTPAVPRTDSSGTGTGTGTKSSFNNFLSSILPVPNQAGSNPVQPSTAPSPNTTDKQPQAKEKVQQVFTNFLDSIIPPAPQPQTQPNNALPNPIPTVGTPTAVQTPKETDPKPNGTATIDAGTTQYPAAAFVPEKKEPEKKDKFNLQKFTDSLRDKVKEEILPEAAKGLDEIKKFFKTGTLKKNDDKDKTSNEPAAPKAIELENVKTRFVTEKVNALRRKPTNLVLPSKSTTLSTSIATSHVTRAEHMSDNDLRRAAVLTPLLKQWLKYFDNELRQFIDLTSNNDKLFLKQEEKVQEDSTENGTASTAPVELHFVSKKSIELLLTECYRYKAFNDTTSVNELDLMDNFIENYWGLFNYNEVYLHTWQSRAQSALTKLDRRGEEYYSQLLAAYEAKAAEQQTSDELVLTSSIREAQLRKQIQQKIQSDALGDALQQIENHNQWSLLLRNIELLLSKNAPATIQVLVNRSDELLPSLMLENIDEKNKSQYLKKLLKERKIHRKNSALVHELLKELIIESPPNRSQLFDEDNKLRTDALKVEWSNGYSLMKILAHSNKYQFETQAVEELTREHGFIKGLKLMLVHNKKHEELISLIVELDDLDEFENVLVKNPVTSTPANWTHLIRAVLAQTKATSDAKTTSQARRINVLFVAHRAITALGPRTAVSVLQTCLKDQQTQLPASFFSAVLAETRAEVWAKLPIVRESLEVLDSHLWSVRSAALGAPFAEVFNHEVDSQVNDLNVDLPFVAIGANGQDEPNFEYIEHSPAYFEEANVHWGVSTNLTTHKCAQCMLPMSESNGTKIFISHPSQHHASAPVHEKCYSLTH